eukprot:s510_g7.t1
MAGGSKSFRRTPWILQQLSMLGKQAWLCFFLGFVRSYLNSIFLLGDFMGGGTDLFSALLAICSVYNVCAVNGALPPCRPALSGRPSNPRAPGLAVPAAGEALPAQQVSSLFIAFRPCRWEKIKKLTRARSIA